MVERDKNGRFIGNRELTEQEIVDMPRPEQTAKSPVKRRKRSLRNGVKKLPRRLNIPDSALSKSELYWRRENAVNALKTKREQMLIDWFKEEF